MHTIKLVDCGITQTCEVCLKWNLVSMCLVLLLNLLLVISLRQLWLSSNMIVDVMFLLRQELRTRLQLMRAHDSFRQHQLTTPPKTWKTYPLFDFRSFRSFRPICIRISKESIIFVFNVAQF